MGQHAPPVPESRANLATSRRASSPGDSLDGLAHLPMPLMPVSPPSAGVAGRALPAVDWLGGSVPSLAHQGSLRASLQMVLVGRVLLSSLLASELALWLDLLRALARVSLEQFLVQPLAQALLGSSGRVSLVWAP